MERYKYKYEMHLHTAEVSKCAVSGAADYPKYYHDRGYTGFCVTDHFFNGNVTDEIGNETDWKTKVELFCKGYETAKAAAEPYGMDVFFGWESSILGWAHLLTYGLDKQWLLSHPDILEWKPETYLDRVHADGGFIVHAHPFRDRVDTVHLFPDKTDAVEIVNTSQSETANGRAKVYSKMLSLPVTAGSDMHKASENRLLGAVLTSRRISDITEYTRLLAEGKTRICVSDYAEVCANSQNN